ncbi:uncharacterized protein PFL1_04787 [Pseudozyma flocculosa PF-1]|nr:uncharacterized protein PFL1_04787 [Pseudozyma flocculosa PF-1]EPQ27649.1 hypothetical protein PFL1_04787 [Pseudozyma flocculosa PF-1]
MSAKADSSEATAPPTLASDHPSAARVASLPSRIGGVLLSSSGGPSSRDYNAAHRASLETSSEAAGSGSRSSATITSHLTTLSADGSAPEPASSASSPPVSTLSSSDRDHREPLSAKASSALRKLHGHRQPAAATASSTQQQQQQQQRPEANPSEDMFSSASHYFSSGGRQRSGSGSILGTRRGHGEAEVTATVSLWQPAITKHGSSGLSKAPLLRDVPNVKQRLSKRGSSSSKADVGPASGFDRAIMLKQTSSSWLREKPSRTRLSLPQSSTSSNGSWRRATVLFRDNGVLSIFNEDNALLHSIQCSNLSATDIRSVEDSLFGRPNVLGIFARPSSFVGARAASPPSSSVSTSSAFSATPPSTPIRQEPIFLHLTSASRLQYWRTLLKIFAQPEVFGPPGSAVLGGTHRRFRQIELTIFEAKSIMPKLPVDTTGHHHLQSHDNFYQEGYNSAGVSPSLSNRELPYSPHLRSSALDRAKPGRSSFDADTSLQQVNSSTTDDRIQRGLDRGEAGSPMAGGASGRGTPIREEGEAGRIDDDGRQSRAASINDAASINASEVSSIDDLVSGPVTGLAGASRFTSTDAQHSSSQPQSSATRQRIGSPRMQPPRSFRSREKDLFTAAAFDRYCRILMNGEVVARTQPRFNGGGSDAAYNVEKFKLIDLPDVESFTVEVLHATQKSSSTTGSPTSQAGASQKFVLLGIVEVPIDSLRRGEEIEGRFPIWSIAAVHGGTGEAGDKSMPFHKGMVGELKMSIKLREETILPLSVYREIDDRLHAPDAPELIQGLAKYLSEESVVPHLVDFYAASGSITERLAALADLESASWGERVEPEMLFRANTLLSRSVDHFQRLLALPWLDSCVGTIVRALCDDFRPSQNGVDGPGMPPMASVDGQFDSAAVNRSPALSGWSSDLPLTIEVLRKLSESLWESIYAQRHRCPPELRTVLSDIRVKVNRRYAKSKSTRPGIQGVGAFIFLRLFCAALNAPQLYGLTPCQPSRTSQRKLLLLSKVLLALANKKMSFDKDKDRDLLPLNDFLTTYGPAFDDYITVVSTEPPKLQKARLLGISYDDDGELQRSAQRKLDMMPVLHKESIPAPPYMLDRPLALASFVAFVVRTAEERLYDLDGRSEDDGTPYRSDARGPEADMLKRKTSDLDRRVDQLIDLCCEVEAHAGRFIEAAGYNPQPIRSTRHILSPLRPGDVTRLGSVVTTGNALPPFPHIPSPPSADLTSNLGKGRADRSPHRSPSAKRTRSATITASPYRSPGRADASGSPRRGNVALESSGRDQPLFAPAPDGRDDVGPFSPPGSSERSTTSVDRYPSRSAHAALARSIARVSEEDQPAEASEHEQRPPPLVYDSGLEASRQLNALGRPPTTTGSNDPLLMIEEDGSTFEPVYPPATLLSSSTQPDKGGIAAAGADADAASTGLAVGPSVGAGASGATRRHSSRSASVTPKTSGVMLGAVRRHSAELAKKGGLGLSSAIAAGLEELTLEDQRSTFRPSTGVHDGGIGEAPGFVRPSTATSSSTQGVGHGSAGGGPEKKKKWWRPG